MKRSPFTVEQRKEIEEIIKSFGEPVARYEENENDCESESAVDVGAELLKLLEVVMGSYLRDFQEGKDKKKGVRRRKLINKIKKHANELASAINELTADDMSLLAFDFPSSSGKRLVPEENEWSMEALKRVLIDLIIACESSPPAFFNLDLPREMTKRKLETICLIVDYFYENYTINTKNPNPPLISYSEASRFYKLIRVIFPPEDSIDYSIREAETRHKQHIQGKDNGWWEKHISHKKVWLLAMWSPSVFETLLEKRN
jgi:hypothetical protein